MFLEFVTAIVLLMLTATWCVMMLMTVSESMMSVEYAMVKVF